MGSSRKTLGRGSALQALADDGAGIFSLRTLILMEPRGGSPQPCPLLTLLGGLCHRNRKLPSSLELGRKGPISTVCRSGPKPLLGRKAFSSGRGWEVPHSCCALAWAQAGLHGRKESRTPQSGPSHWLPPCTHPGGHEGGARTCLHVHSQCPASSSSSSPAPSSPCTSHAANTPPKRAWKTPK